MTQDGWRLLIVEAVHDSENGNDEKLDLLALHLQQCDQAKQVLRDKGYGWTGVDILETASMVVSS